jgi:MarR family transcriptional regulator, 2-MHQ and catechol-resistance regulon repressor
MMNNKNYNSESLLDLKLITVLSRCLQSINKMENPVITESGLTMAQFGVMEIIYHLGPQRICSIIEKTLSSGGNMTVVIDNLEKQKLISRVPDPNDRRATLIELTNTGLEKISKLFPDHLKNLSKTLSVLSSEEKKQLIDLAKKLGKQ